MKNHSIGRAIAKRGVVAAATLLVLGLVAFMPAKPDPVAVADISGATLAVAETCGSGAEKVLVLQKTQQYFGSCAHPTVTSAVGLGFAVDVATDAEWAAMNGPDFASYRALVMGDSACSGGTEQVDAAEANAATWSPAVDGNVIVIGTDESYHTGGRGEVLTQEGMAFATADPAKTGAYISLSCYYHYYEPANVPTAVDVLAGFGTFKALRTAAISPDDCYNDVHIVASHPAMAGLTDANLENWGCSVHEAFSEWPLEFEVLTIAENIGTEFFTAPDGTKGAPYILARGVAVISDIALSPADATNTVGQSHTLTAHVAEDGVPVVGTTVTFSVIAGPHAGLTGNAPTDSNGDATFAYTGTAVGTDTIEATFVDSQARTQRSNRVAATWGAGSTREGPPGDPTCSNRGDDDGDGLVDLADPDCQSPEGPFGHPSCSDLGDNDGDGLVDEADPDCTPPFDPCSDAGLLTTPTLGQQLWGADVPLTQNPAPDGPVSGPVEGLRGSVPDPLGLAVHDAACLTNLLFLDL